MAFRNSFSAAASFPGDGRCVACRDGLDRMGRYCAKCVRSRRIKMFFAVVVLGQCAAAAYYVTRDKPVDQVVPSDGLSHTVAVSKPNGPTGWYYFDVTDPLIEDVSHHARLIADTPMPANGAPPSPGATSGTLDVSFSKHYGKSVLLTFPKLPNACLANQCALHAVFDSDVPQDLDYDDVSGHGATVFMLTKPADFLKRLPNARGLTFIANLGMPTDTTITFDVQGFNLKTAALAGHVRTAATRPGGPPDPG